MLIQTKESPSFTLLLKKKLFFKYFYLITKAHNLSYPLAIFHPNLALKPRPPLCLGLQIELQDFKANALLDNALPPPKMSHQKVHIITNPFHK